MGDKDRCALSMALCGVAAALLMMGICWRSGGAQFLLLAIAALAGVGGLAEALRVEGARARRTATSLASARYFDVDRPERAAERV
jgi:hypothetical protein